MSSSNTSSRLPFRQTGLWGSRNPLLAILATLFVIAIGIFASRKLAIDAVPDVTNVQVQVVTRAPSLSATEVEAQITQPVERAMAGAPGLTQVRSISKLGISIVTLIFNDDTDVYFARAQVSERLSTLRETIPASVGVPELGPVTTALGEIYMFELRPDGSHPRSAEELRTIIDWQVAPRLRQVTGVVEVVGFGGNVKQYRVTLDPAKLAAHRVGAAEVRSALSKDNRVAGGGFVESGGEQIVLRGDGRFRAIEDIEDVVVRTDDRGIPIRVGELGEVDTGPTLRQGAMTRDGRGEIVGASVMMLKGQNSRDVVAGVKAAIEVLKPQLPSGLRVEPYYDRASFIDDVLRTVAKNLTEGALIVVVCLLLTLGSVRAWLVVAGAIPFAMLVGFLGLVLTGYSGNVMSLGAVDFGIVVEGAVLVVEHAMTHGALGNALKERQRNLREAMSEVARPAIFGVVITLLVFLPLMTLEDVEGQMFRPVVVSLCFMLAGALFYALVFVPAIAPRFLTKVATVEEPWLVRKVRKVYEPLVDRVLLAPRKTLAVAGAVTALLLASGATIGAEFLPRIFEGAFALDASRPPSTALGQAISLSKEMEIAIRETPEVETVVSRIGRPEGAVDPAGPESSDVFVILKPRKQWREGVTPESLANELSERVAARVPATQAAVSQPIEMRVNDIVAGVKSDLAIKIKGEDLEQMTEAASMIRRAVAEVDGAADVKMEIATGLPALNVRVNRDRAARLGVSSEDVLDTLAMTRAGIGVGQVREGERVFDLVLRVGGEAVDDGDDLERLPVAASLGGGNELVPLRLLADVTKERTVVQVSREQMRRRLVVQANVRGRDIVSFVGEAQAKVASLKLPPGVELEWGGQFQNFNRAKDRLTLLVPVSFAVIAMMLFLTFRRVPHTVVTLLSIPFALAGGIAAMAARGLPFSIPAGVGFIALAGVSVMTGIVMTTNLLAVDEALPAIERVRKAVRASLRAPLSTALVAAVGFIPAALATGTGSEVQRPLATVVIGGLLIAMVLGMLALPAMLTLVAERQDARRETGPNRRPHADEDDEDDAKPPVPGGEVAGVGE
jgi:cobalt-zinc-cadmium resistance protein CzcA